MQNDVKPVSILTGFLGAGKTTLLNAINQSKPDTRFAIIENEFGEQGIDGDLVLKSEADIVEMNNGCLCCTLNDNLYEILHQLWERRSQWDELIIETTGIADPAGVALPFISDPYFQKQFPLKRVICLVDAERIEDLLEETEEAIKQISFADVILLNKKDLVEAEYLIALKNQLEKINPLGSFFETMEDDFPVDELFSIERIKHAEEKHRHLEKNHEGHHHHHHHSSLVALSFKFPEPMDMQKFQARMMAFLLFQSQGIYRLKGIIHTKTSNHKIILQSVGNNISLAGGSPWKAEEERSCRLVIIGKNLKPDGYEKMLKDCLDYS